MVFQSLDYLAFLILVFGIYWILPRRPQNWFLLVASYFFYGYIHPWYGVLIATTTLVDWGSARAIAHGGVGRRRYLVLSLVTNFSILAVFKYFGFFTDNLIAIGQVIGFDLDQPHFRVLLPVGISFYTFQSASYVVDVFRGRTQVRRRLDDYALFVCFFPQLVAGPIERANHLLRQVENKRRFNPWEMRSGLLLILWGLFQKKCIADNTAVLVNKVFALENSAFPLLWGGVFAFGVQIYADFSAYTNIARGSARLLGFDLCRNFNHPYRASSPADFWRRWHISLSTWFRDYVYIPLGGNRGGSLFTLRNIGITFALSGLWHGANWNFVLWGCYHGVLVAGWHVVSERVPKLGNGGGRLGSAARVTLTFVLVHIGWLMFREQNFDYLLRWMTLSPVGLPLEIWETGMFIVLQAMIYALPMSLIPLITRWTGPEGERLPPSSSWSRTLMDAGLAALLIAGVLTLASPTASDFIYFQF